VISVPRARDVSSRRGSRFLARKRELGRPRSPRVSQQQSLSIFRGSRDDEVHDMQGIRDGQREYCTEKKMFGIFD